MLCDQMVTGVRIMPQDHILNLLAQLAFLINHPTLTQQALGTFMQRYRGSPTKRNPL